MDRKTWIAIGKAKRAGDFTPLNNALLKFLDSGLNGCLAAYSQCKTKTDSLALPAMIGETGYCYDVCRKCRPRPATRRTSGE